MKGNCLEAIAGHSARVLSDRLSLCQPLVKQQPLSQCQVCVIVPARNEAMTIASTLLSLAQQVDFQGHPLHPYSYEVIALFNNCTDNSAAIAHQFAKDHPNFVLHIVEMAFSPAEAYIGRVRQVLMDEAYRRLAQLGRWGVIASTDGDTRVAPDWIAATLAEIQEGADAVAGRLLSDRHERSQLDSYTKTCYLQAVGYGSLSAELESQIDPDPFDQWPRHHQHGGASLAVTAEMYAIAGGLPATRTPEDVAFYQALMRVNARFRHSLKVRVFPSMRQKGRALNGMANQLSEWTHMGRQQQPYLVESTAALETRLWARRSLRAAWHQGLDGHLLKLEDIQAIAHLFQINSQWLSQALGQALSQALTQPLTFSALHEQVEQQQLREGNWQLSWHLIEIKQAIAELRLRIYQLRQTRKSLQPAPNPVLSYSEASHQPILASPRLKVA